MTIDSLAYRRRAGLVYPRKKPPYNLLLRPIEGHPLADFVGCWLFNEAGGDTVYDLSGNGNDGTINGATWGPGRDGPALRFVSVSNHYVNCGPNADIVDVSKAFTFAIWFRFTTVNPVGHDRLMSTGESGTNYGALVCAYVTNGNICFGDNGGFRYTAVEYNDGLWHHAACVYDGGSGFTALKIYIDGQEQSYNTAGAFTTFDQSSEDFAIGGNRDDGSTEQCWNDMLDGAIVYQRALSAQEIWQLFRYPYCMLAVSEMAWLYYEAVAGLSIPVAMHHYRALRA